MPSIEGGGLEKNLYIISNFLSKKINNIALITVSKNERNKFNKIIEFISPKYLFWNKLNKEIKYLCCLYLLLLEFLKNKKTLVFCFQANLYCILLCRLFNIEVIIRSNSSPTGWSNNFGVQGLGFQKIVFSSFPRGKNISFNGLNAFINKE